MSKWRVYYDDGSTWDWTEGVKDAPAYGVLCILQSTTRYHIVYGAPYYAYNGEWLHFHENDMVDYLVNQIPIEKLIVGRMVSKEVFADIYEKAKQDKDLENLG